MRRPFGETMAACTPGQAKRFRVIGHTPARVHEETGEQFFAPETAVRPRAMAAPA